HYQNTVHNVGYQSVQTSTLFPYTTLFRSKGELGLGQPAMQGFGINGQQTATVGQRQHGHGATPFVLQVTKTTTGPGNSWEFSARSEEHTSELQSRVDIVCRLLLEKKKKSQ